MALIPLYTSAAAVDLTGTELGRFGITNIYYVPSTDSFFVDVFTKYRLWRDGHVVRISNDYGGEKYYYEYGVDLPLYKSSDTVKWRIDPITWQPRSSDVAPFTYSFTEAIPGPLNVILHNGLFYYFSGASSVTSVTITVKNATTGATVRTITSNGLLYMGNPRVFLNPNMNLLYIVCFDAEHDDIGNVRAYDLTTDTQLSESSFPKAYCGAYDHVTDTLLVISQSDSKVRLYSLQPAPSSFTPFTVSSHRGRYQQDTITATLKGSDGELIRNWPVGWTLSSGEGHLEHSYTVTDENGDTSNLYCGPGIDDFAGGSQILSAWTAY